MNNPKSAAIKLAAYMTLLSFALLPATGMAQPKRVQRVSNAQQMVSAIRNGIRIELEPGTYNLSSVREERDMSYIRWEPGSENKTVTVHDVTDLQIVGVGQGEHRIIVSPRDVFVLAFENCKNVTLENITFGHDPIGGECFDGVLRFFNSMNIVVRKCDLFGCGTEGLSIEGVNGFLFEKSSIRDCNAGIMTVSNGNNLKFVKSAFFNNKESYSFQFTESNQVTFTDCVIAGNESKGPLFDLTNCGLIKLTGGFIILNDVTQLTNQSRSMMFDDVNMKNAISPKG